MHNVYTGNECLFPVKTHVICLVSLLGRHLTRCKPIATDILGTLRLVKGAL